MLPPRAQAFVGREEDVHWLLQHLKDPAEGTILALCGPGGIGKTGLAARVLTHVVDYQEQSTGFPNGIFYHSFYTSASLPGVYEDLARLFGEKPGANPERSAIRALSCHRALLVFDGVEILETAQPLWMLAGRSTVLILSQRPSDAPNPMHIRDLGLLSLTQSTALVRKLAGPWAADQRSVEQLVQQIKGYPLALQIVGSYLASRQEKVADYLKWFEREGLVRDHQGTHQDQRMPILLQRIYDTLTSSEQQVFVLLGLLAPVPFPVSLIENILELPEWTVRNALDLLVNLSVLRRRERGYEVSHPFVHTFANERLLPQSQARLTKRLLAVLSTHFEHSDPYDRGALVLWHPHVLPLLSPAEVIDEQPLRKAHLFNTIGLVAYTQGKYAEAEPLLQQALAIREQQLGTSHPDTASSLNNLTALYVAQNKYVEAEPLYQRALAICEQQLGASHPDTASSLNNLAMLYQTQGKYAEAEPLYRRALAICENVLGQDHPYTKTVQTNYSRLLQMM